MKITIRNFFLIFFFALGMITYSLGQSKFEFGIGLGINHSKIDEDIKTLTGQGISSNKGMRLLALKTRIGYKFNDNFHLNSGLGFSWLGSLNKNLEERVIATNFEVPLQLEWNLWKHILLSSGPVYNYIVGISNELNNMEFDILPFVDSRHQLGLRHGISYSYEQIELFVNYTHYLTNLFTFSLTDSAGNFIGSSVSKFRNIQLGVIFRV